MATIRAYTTIEQSRKLAEILQLESADMCYLSEESLIPKVIYNGMAFFNSKEERLTNIIYCWSLAALIGVLPKYELNNFGDTIQLAVSREALATEGNETLLDLVVNMIIHLHELNLL